MRQRIDIQYDAAKEDGNLRRHGLGFDDAVELLEGATFIVEDVRRDYGEQRFIAYGWVRQRFHVCVYTLRGSAHRARPTGGSCMPLVRKSFEEARRSVKKTDWARVDAMTDEDIARQIAEDPDVAPDMSEAIERGEFSPLYVVGLYGIRTDMGLSHEAFAARFGLSPDDVRAWEARGGPPHEAIRTYLEVIAHEPEAVARAVAAARAEQDEAVAAK